MRRAFGVAVGAAFLLASACGGSEGNGGAAGGGGGGGSVGGPCAAHPDAVTLISPEATATTIKVGDPIVIRWTPGVPDRYTSMVNDQGLSVLSSEEQTAEGTELSYSLIAGVTYSFEAGWLCAENEGSSRVPIVALTLLAEP